MAKDVATCAEYSSAGVLRKEVDIRTSIRPTLGEIDLAAIRRNATRVRGVVGNGCQVWAVVKADAYGHGAVEVARGLQDFCDGFAVSLVEEGLELRAAGIVAPIVVLSAYYNAHHDEVLARRLTPVLYDVGDLERFEAAARRRSLRADVHLKVDTGMTRLGVSEADLASTLERLRDSPHLYLSGLCTHFASADVGDEAPTVEALSRFRACTRLAAEMGFTRLVHHASNSAATLRFPEARLDAVRPGLALYGAMPSAHVQLEGVEPTFRLTSRIMAEHRVPSGTSVSYGGTWRASRPSRIGTLPVGYADGYPRHVRDAQVLVRGQRVPIVGVVCMDLLMIDLTDAADASVGDVVTLLGTEGGAAIGLDDLARWAGTINYEILCGISKRVPRVYREH